MQSPEDLKNALLRAVDRVGQGTSDFDLNPEVVLPKGRVLKQAGVLMAVTHDAQVILTKRSAHLKNHPGQIAFPGGRMDDTDTDLVQTALREAQEEIGLDPTCVDVLGPLPSHETVTSYTATPIVALIPSGLTFTPEPGEVAEVFTVPLSHVTTIANFAVQGRRWRGQRRQYYTVPYGPHYIWGATARMLRSLAEVWDD
ncbi:CoA pyrophosphatase [Pseudooctadecabacter jejudonensis]|uniref:Putative NUDIX hydrolase n=1 Tax=Pseudooctadecabacter jejudonensis TaxID=1391910 RepID=A0A1Y5SAG6_9RHOB|nr:CoA pyrophosphatase [Pseudooctadecabacter jejudonensis]SLN33650.1 putative NUDIX hydrolase [Pseudooctadecabacter jejudonensis]